MNIEFAFSVSNKPNSPIISADHVISTHKGPRGYSRYFLSDGCLQRPQGVKLVFGLIGDEDNKDGIPRKGIYVQQTKVKHIREDSWILSRIWKHNWKKSFRLESGFFLSWLSGTMAIREWSISRKILGRCDFGLVIFGWFPSGSFMGADRAPCGHSA